MDVAITTIKPMKKPLFILSFLFLIQVSLAQTETAFQDGEWFRFRMSYSGFLKAGNATLKVDETTYKGKPVYHVVGKGWTTGAIKWFFKVRDRYVDNKKHNTQKVFTTEENVQDMVSAFYYLRNNYDTSTIKKGDMVSLNMFFDEENFNFKLKFLGRETIETEFGKVKTLVFRPYVMAGRVFKEQESLTLWVSADKNKIPLKVKADLAVGSLRADLEAFKGLKHSFQIQFD